MSDPTNLKPPYIAFATFKNFIDSFPNGILPSRIDKSIMGNLSGGNQTSILSTLRFFEMIDESGKPTENLRLVVEGDENSKNATWKRIVETSYNFLFSSGLDLQRATEGQLADKFREHDLNGDTLRKCQFFFVSICGLADISLGPLIKPKAANGVARTPRRKSRKRRVESESIGSLEPPIPPAATKKTVQELLLEKFPSFDPSWSPELQVQWFSAYQKLLSPNPES